MVRAESSVSGGAPRPGRTARAQDFDALAPARDRWIARNRYYHDELARAFSFFIPPGRSVLEIGSGTGELLNSLKPSRGVGIDLSPGMVEVARRKFPQLEFRVDDLEQLELDGTFEYIVIADLLGFLHDVQSSFERLRALCTPRTRVVISYYNVLWEPILVLGERVGLKAKQPVQSWLGPHDVENLLDLSGFEIIRRQARLLLPKYVPGLSEVCNRFLVHLPIVEKCALAFVSVARPKSTPRTGPCSVSVVVPARNERGNIEDAVRRTPHLGAHTEIVFVEGNSSDGTEAEIERVMAAYPDRDISLVRQGSGRGKGDAVRKGFAAAKGDILMILDADLTVAPEDLPKFYRALVGGQGEFIHGSRLVYPMEKQAMRSLNIVANKFFSVTFSYLLEQRFKDTLCGTKVLFKDDYDLIAANRGYFGEFDPFGDFDLIFGAAKLNLKIVEIPVHYYARTYGTTNISRFRHGWLLLKMSLFAMRKLKFI
jgi:SAM-dependent methyltransferase